MLPSRMPLAPLIAALLAVGAASVAGQCAGASGDTAWMSVFAAGAFAGAMIRVGWQLNRPWWHAPHSDDIGPSHAEGRAMMAQRNAELIALGYAWGGVSLLAVYLLSGLRWQHGWQYGSGMVVIAGLLFALSRSIVANWSPILAQRLALITLLHGWAATAGAAWLVGSGKMLSIKGDWAANVVFLAGAAIIVAISALALRTERMLQHR